MRDRIKELCNEEGFGEPCKYMHDESYADTALMCMRGVSRNHDSGNIHLKLGYKTYCLTRIASCPYWERRSLWQRWFGFQVAPESY